MSIFSGSLAKYSLAIFKLRFFSIICKSNTKHFKTLLFFKCEGLIIKLLDHVVIFIYSTNICIVLDSDNICKFCNLVGFFLSILYKFKLYGKQDMDCSRGILIQRISRVTDVMATFYCELYH